MVEQVFLPLGRSGQCIMQIHNAILEDHQGSPLNVFLYSPTTFFSNPLLLNCLP